MGGSVWGGEGWWGEGLGALVKGFFVCGFSFALLCFVLGSRWVGMGCSGNGVDGMAGLLLPRGSGGSSGTSYDVKVWKALFDDDWPPLAVSIADKDMHGNQIIENTVARFSTQRSQRNDVSSILFHG